MPNSHYLPLLQSPDSGSASRTRLSRRAVTSTISETSDPQPENITEDTRSYSENAGQSVLSKEDLLHCVFDEVACLSRHYPRLSGPVSLAIGGDYLRYSTEVPARVIVSSAAGQHMVLDIDESASAKSLIHITELPNNQGWSNGKGATWPTALHAMIAVAHPDKNTGYIEATFRELCFGVRIAKNEDGKLRQALEACINNMKVPGEVEKTVTAFQHNLKSSLESLLTWQLAATADNTVMLSGFTGGVPPLPNCSFFQLPNPLIHR